MLNTVLQAPDSECREDLERRIVTLYASINAATYQLLELIAEFDQLSGGQHGGFLSTAHWLGYYCGIGPNAAREKVRVARALITLPLIRSAFAEGWLSYSKVRALSRVATPANEAALLKIARHATAQQTERILRDYVDTTRARGPVPTTPSLSWSYDDYGQVVLKGRLPAELGALLIKAVERTMDGLAADVSASSSERRAEALLQLAEVALTDPERDTERSHAQPSAARYTVHVELNAGALEGPRAPQVRDGGQLTQAAVERLTCDASLVAHEIGGDGEPLNVGRKTRVVSGPLRRALHRRDRGCRFPGCTQSRFVDAHHVLHWAHGGETKLSNLVLLCSRHHRLVHEGAFRLVAYEPRQGAAQFHFYTSDGEKLAPVGENLRSNVRRLGVTAVTSVAAAPLKPENPSSRPDYHHIAWYLGSFVPRE